MKMCCNCEYFQEYHKICKRELVVSGVFKCVFEYNKACKNYKKKENL